MPSSPYRKTVNKTHATVTTAMAWLTQAPYMLQKSFVELGRHHIPYDEFMDALSADRLSTPRITRLIMDLELNSGLLFSSTSHLCYQRGESVSWFLHESFFDGLRTRNSGLIEPSGTEPNRIEVARTQTLFLHKVMSLVQMDFDSVLFQEMQLRLFESYQEHMRKEFDRPVHVEILDAMFEPYRGGPVVFSTEIQKALDRERSLKRQNRPLRTISGMPDPLFKAAQGA